MKLIVGLGNPGPEYAKTRHNAGFMVVDRLASRHGLTGVKSKFNAGLLEGHIAGEKAVLLQPMAFMNRSGLPIAEAMRFYKVELEDVLVVVDEVALPLGKIRLRPSGSAGGHNGLKDVQQKLATTDYPRLRIGIDPSGRVSQVDYVLGRFTAEQFAQLDPTLDRACDCIESWIRDGIDKTMTLFNAA